ncbi:MAG TPA: ABC transporter permease [Anaerolineae bacterium]|nr:ABC transporter permease [Anaerolineae bacterium]
MLTQISDLWENVRVALDGLAANKLRAALTMLGVIIGVGSVIALMSIGAGAQEQITAQINSIGTNLLIVMPQSTGRVDGSSGGRAEGLTLDDVAALTRAGAVPDAQLIVPEYSVSGQIIYGDTNFSVSAVGTTPDYQALNDLSLAQGEFLSAEDVDKRAKVVVLGWQVAQDLFGEFDPVGQKIKVATANGQKTSLTVIGVLAEQGGSMFNNADSNIFIPLSTAQTKLANARNVYGKLAVSRVNIMAASEAQVDAAYDQVEAVLLKEHNLTPLDDADFRLINQADMLDMATTVTDIMTLFLGAVAGISLVVGGIGIMNIMLVSVTERTREIGLRKSIGARRSDVLLQFLMEAVILSLIGGGIGIALGIGVGELINLTGLISSVVTLESVLLAVGFSFAIGLFFGIYPANQAAKLSPIEALRYE